MKRPNCLRRTKRPARQAGVALLMLLIAILLAATYTMVSRSSPARAKMEREIKTGEALAQAKAALMAWSVLQGELGTGLNPRPGNLPCPDRTNTGVQGSSCSASGGTTIGRLPWKTLGIDDLRDADGERLWYVVSNNFRSANLQNDAINSDTPGTLKLYAANGTTLLTAEGEELVAIVFSPGAPLPGQSRGSGTNNADDYLEAANSRDNTRASGPFITGPVADEQGGTLLNDRLIGISAIELIAAIEKRALNEAQAGLAAYAADRGGKYPNPARRNGSHCTSKIENVANPESCDSDSSVCFGRLPEDSLGSYVATWFQQNGWGRNLIYAVNRNNVRNIAAECSSSLNVDGQTRKYVLVAPGIPKNWQSRPSSSLSNYLEDSANLDAWTTSSLTRQDFVTPGTTSNDQMRSQP